MGRKSMLVLGTRKQFLVHSVRCSYIKIQRGALLRIVGRLGENSLVSVEQIVILIKVAQVAESSSSAQ